MRHNVHTFVCPEPFAKDVIEAIQVVKVVEAEQGFVFLPILYELLEFRYGVQESFACFEIFNFEMNKRMLELTKRVNCSVAYVETEYFYGTGSQSAVSWANGKILMSPRLSETTWNKLWRKVKVSNGHPINEALKSIGVKCLEGYDEFDSVNLGSYRDFENEDELF